MKINIRYISLFILFACMISKTFAEESACLAPKEIARITIQDLDNTRLNSCSLLELAYTLGSVELLSIDSHNISTAKSDIFYALLADELQRRNTEDDSFDPKHPTVVFLVAKLKEQQYTLGLNRPSDWEKLWKYMSEGRWRYIFQRFFDRNMHIYFLLLLTPLLIGLYFFKKSKRKNG